MSWKRQSPPQSLIATKKIAAEFAEMTPAPGDRNPKPKTSAVIEAALAAGTFRHAAFASCYCNETNILYRVNGKHTATALANMEAFPKRLPAIVERYEADTIEDVAKLYATFDTRSSVRSTGDINKSFAASNPALNGISLRIISICVTGISLAKYADKYAFMTTPEERAAYVNEYTPFVLWFNEIIGPKHKESSHILRAPTCAAAFLMFSKSQKDASTFWELVRDGSGPNHKSPDRVLSRHLLQTSVNMGKGRSGKAFSTSFQMMVRCIYAWNAWREGITTNLKFHVSIGKKIPAVK